MLFLKINLLYTFTMAPEPESSMNLDRNSAVLV